MDFSRKPVIACIHLLPTPGTHLFDGDIIKIYETALSDAAIFLEYGADALIVENFRDGPFYPCEVPPATTATIAGVAREIVRLTDKPVGVAVLRNDAEAAMSIATAIGAKFIRVNVHLGAVLSEQGILQGECHKTLRLRANLKSSVAIYADVAVKHSRALVYETLAEEVKDTSLRAEAIIVSGAKTGIETETNKLFEAKKNTMKPVIVGSGVTPDNIEKIYEAADGFIVGSYFKKDGNAFNPVDEIRVKKRMEKLMDLRSK